MSLLGQPDNTATGAAAADGCPEVPLTAISSASKVHSGLRPKLDSQVLNGSSENN